MEITVQYIISQVFTIISYLFLASTYYVKKRKSVLILNCIVQISFIVAFLLLRAWTGLVMTIIALIRNIIFVIDENKNGKREHMNKTDIIILVVLYIISIVSAVFTYEGFFSLLSVFATMLYTYTVCQKNIKTYKLLGIPTEILWICYNIYIKSLFGIILELIMFGVCCTGYIKEINKERKIMKEIIIASENVGKIKEAQEILNDYRIIPMKELGITTEIEEDQETFEGNAIKKAETIAKKLNGKMCMADDSGIEIEYLNGFPGVYTKRWHAGTDRERNLAIIEKLKNVPKEKRKIKFVTAIALSNGENTISVTAEIDGYVTESVRGSNGFGFDEIFELENGKTLAEISQEEKNKISARKKALEELKKKLSI